MEKFIFHELPHFSGSQNVLDWIDHIERAGAFAKWNDEDVRKVARLRIRGEASEFVRHLELEDKAGTWKSLKKLLTERYESKGQEQLNQYLLSTSQQGGKTVQEWAQVVRKLSLYSLSDLDREPHLETEPTSTSVADDTVGDEGREVDVNDGDGAGRNSRQPGADEEHAEEMHRLRKRKERLLLDHMRRVNFVRGLKPDLRRAVLEKGCSTFDDAVKAAQKEENLNIAVGQEELLNSMCAQPDAARNHSVNDVAVAVVQLLEQRERARDGARGREDTRGGRTIPLPNDNRRQSDQRHQTDRYYGDQGRYRSDRNQHRGNQDRGDRHYAEQGRYKNDRHQYPGNQDRASDRDFQQSQRNPRWQPSYRSRQQGRQRSYSPEETQRERYLQRMDDIHRGACFSCHQTGHLVRDCGLQGQQQQGNGYGRF